MASATHVQTSTPASDSGDGFQWLGGDFAPRDEARGLFALIRHKTDSVEAVRELIAVPPAVEDALRLYVSHYPEDAQGIEKVLRFRKRVREEFDRLVRALEKPAPIAQLRGV
jgi:hypothetical protein